MITFQDLGLSPVETEWLISLLNSPELEEVTTQIIEPYTFLESDYFLNKISEKGYFPCELKMGASKVCFVPRDYPFVIKWTLESSETNFDEAGKEAFIYKQAKENRLAEFFPKTEEIESHGSTCFIYQEKIDYESCNISPITRSIFIKKTANSNQRVVKRLSNGLNIDSRPNEVWCKMALLIYGKRKCRSLVRFVRKYHINDLHDGNTGYFKGKPVILDFSGYSRESW